MYLSADDDVSRLRAVWLGPAGTRWPMDWTYVEWFIASIATLPVAIVSTVFLIWALGSGWVLWMVSIAFGLAAGGAAGWCAKVTFGPLVDPDRPLWYLARLAYREVGRVVWACGPVDRVAVVLTVPMWLLVLWLTPGPWPLKSVPLVAGCYWLALLLVGRFQSNQRHWVRAIARAERSAEPVLIEYTIPMEGFDP